jgi:hypothetical protein
MAPKRQFIGYEKTLRKMLEFLELDPASARIPPPYFAQFAGLQFLDYHWQSCEKRSKVVL